MPKNALQSAPSPEVDHHISVESSAYLDGLFQELQRQIHHYVEFTRMLHNVEARLELAEKTLSLTRDHLMMTISQTDSARPRDWKGTLDGVRFVGVRLVDACQVLLQERKKMTPEELLMALNEGMYHFRTNSPLREIHAAMLRQNFAKREDEYWVWIGKSEQQIPMRLRSDKPAEMVLAEPEQ